ncbi:MAG: DUF1573 domain-containing protein [Bacteroidetes bacterium]|nr:MAG: DUF1573 domain-containing protein [Bacteroidota bacterium]
MKLITFLSLILATVSLNLCFAQKTIVLETKNGEAFKAWINGKPITQDYVVYAEGEVPSAGTYSIMVEVEGVSTKIKKSVVMNQDWQKMRWWIKEKKGKWAIKIDALYTGTGASVNLGSSSGGQHGSSSSKKGGVKFDGTFLEIGTFSKGEVVNYTVNIKSDGDGPLEISQVTVSEPWIEVLDYPKNPIPSGQFAKINVRINVPKNETGRQVEKLIVHGNTFMGKDNVNLEFHITDKVVAEKTPVSTPSPKTKPNPPVTNTKPEEKIFKHNPVSRFTCICEFVQTSIVDNHVNTIQEFKVNVKIMDREEVWRQSNHLLKSSHEKMGKKRVFAGFNDETNVEMILPKDQKGAREEILLKFIADQGRLNKICKTSYTIISK